MSVETQLYLVDSIALKNRVSPAIADFRHNNRFDAASKLLADTMSGDHFQALLKTDPVLADYYAQGSRDLLSGKLPHTELDDRTGEVSHDQEFIRRRRTETVLTRLFVLFWCTRYSESFPDAITLSRGPLADYIRSQSKWIDETLSLSNEFLWDAPDLEPPIGTDAKLLTQDQSAILLDALRRIPAPADPTLRSEYDHLEALLQTAVDSDRYRILICTG
jgi:hypothetical protein